MSTPWFPFWIGRYIADTRNIRTIEHGAYLLLILEYYQHGKLPDDERKIANICKLSVRTFARMRPKLAAFFEMPGWRHKFIEAELEKINKKKEMRAYIGRLGGLASKGQNNNERFVNGQLKPKQLLKQKGVYIDKERKERKNSELAPSPQKGLGASNELVALMARKGSEP